MDELLTIRDIQEKLGISRTSAYDLVREPGFPTCRIGSKIVVPARKLQIWIDNGGSERRDRDEQRA